MSQLTCPPISHNFSIIASDVIIVTKKNLTEKHALDAQNVVLSYACWKRETALHNTIQDYKFWFHFNISSYFV